MIVVRNDFVKKFLLVVIITVIVFSFAGCGKSTSRNEKADDRTTDVQSAPAEKTRENDQSGAGPEDAAEEAAKGENSNPLMNCEVREAEIKDSNGNRTGTRGYINIPADELFDLTSEQIAEFSMNVVDGRDYAYFTVDFGTGKGIYFPECSIVQAVIGDIDQEGKIRNVEKYLAITENGKVRMGNAEEEGADQKDRQEIISESDREGLDKLQAMGNIQTENGILTVTITLPADLAQGTTQEQLDAAKGKDYLSAVLNQDGSVTYKMTKLQHKNIMDQLTTTFDDSIQEMINDDERYTISNITHNRDFTLYDVTLEGTELGLSDSFSVLGLYMYGGIYGVFSGQRPEHVIVNFRDPNGNLIQSGDSANMKTTAQQVNDIN